MSSATTIIPSTTFSNKTRNRLQHLLQDVEQHDHNNASTTSVGAAGMNRSANSSRPGTRGTEADSEDAMIKQRVVNALNGLSGARLRKLLVPCMWLRVWRRRKSRQQQEARNNALQLEEKESGFSSVVTETTTTSSSENKNENNNNDNNNNNNNSKPAVKRSALTSFFTHETNLDRVANHYHQQPSSNQSVSAAPQTVKRRQSFSSGTGNNNNTIALSARYSYRTVMYQTLLSSSFAMKSIGEQTLRARCTGRDGIDEGAVLETLSAGQILLHAYEPVQATGVIVLLSGSLCVSTSCREACGKGPEPGEAPAEIHYFVQGPAAIFPDRVFSDALLPFFVVARSHCEIASVSHSSMIELLDRITPNQKMRLMSTVVRERSHNFKQNFPMTVSLMRSTCWLVQGLPDRSVENLISRMYPVSFFPGSEIFSMGTATDSALFLRRGKIEITMRLTKEQIEELNKIHALKNDKNNNNNDNNNTSPDSSPDNNKGRGTTASSPPTKTDGTETVLSGDPDGDSPLATLTNHRRTSWFSASSAPNVLTKDHNNNNNAPSETVGSFHSAKPHQENLRVTFSDNNNNQNNDNNTIKSVSDHENSSDDDDENNNGGGGAVMTSLMTSHLGAKLYEKTYTYEAPLTLGELGLVLAEKRLVTARAVSFVDAWRLSKEELDHFLVNSRTSAMKILSTAIKTREQWLRSHKDANFIKDSLLNGIPGFSTNDDTKKKFNTQTGSPLKEGEEHSVDFAVSQNKVRVSSLLDDILDELEPCVIPSRTPIAALSNTCNSFYIVVRGRLAEQRRRKYADGCVRFGPGSIIGECCALRHRWTVQICSTTRVDCWRISAGALCSILKRHGRLQSVLEASEIRLREICDAHGVDPPPFKELKPNWNTILDDLTPRDPEADLSGESSSDDDSGSPLSKIANGKWKMMMAKGLPMETHKFEPDLNFGIAAQQEIRILVRSLSETPTARQRCVMRALDVLGLVSYVDKQRIRTPIQVRKRRRLEQNMLIAAQRRGSDADPSSINNSFGSQLFQNQQQQHLDENNNNKNNNNLASSMAMSRRRSEASQSAADATKRQLRFDSSSLSASTRPRAQNQEPQTREEKIISMIRKKSNVDIDDADVLSSSDSGEDLEAEFQEENRKMLAGFGVSVNSSFYYNRDEARKKSMGYAAALLGQSPDGGGVLTSRSYSINSSNQLLGNLHHPDDGGDDTGIIGGAIPFIPEYKVAHLLPHLTLTIATAEKLGTPSSALFALLERPSRLDGVMEGSEPGPYDVSLPEEGDEDYFDEEDEEYYQSYLVEQRKKRTSVYKNARTNYFSGVDDDDETDSVAFSDLDTSSASGDDGVEDDEATTMTEVSEGNNDSNNKQQQQQQQQQQNTSPSATSEKQEQKRIEREERKTRRIIERNKRKWKFMQKRRRQQMIFSSTSATASVNNAGRSRRLSSTTNTNRSFRSRRRSTLANNFNSSTTGFNSSITGGDNNNNNNTYNNEQEAELMAELPASLFARRRRGPQADYRPRNPHSYEANIPDSVAQAEERRKALHAAFKKKLESDEKALAIAREKAIRYLRQQQKSNSGEENNNNNDPSFASTTATTSDGISNQELMAVLFAEQDLVADIAKDAPSDLMDAAIREEDARQKNVTVYAKALQQQQSQTTTKSMEKEMEKIASKLPAEQLTRVGSANHEYNSFESQQNRYLAFLRAHHHNKLYNELQKKLAYHHQLQNNNHGNNSSAANNLLEQSMNRRKTTDLLSASTRGGRRVMPSSHHGFLSYLQDPLFQEINEIVPEELHDMTWERKRLELICEVSENERETRPHLPEFKVKKKKWKFVSKRRTIRDDDDDDDDEDGGGDNNNLDNKNGRRTASASGKKKSLTFASTDDLNNTAATTMSETTTTTITTKEGTTNSQQQHQQDDIFDASASMMSNRNTTTMTENDEGTTTVTITTTNRTSPVSGDEEDGDHSEEDDRDEADEGNRNEDGQQQPSSSSSLPPLDLTKNPPKRKKKTTTTVPRYAQPTEKESFRRLGEEGISSFTRSIEEAEQQQKQEQQQEPSPDATMTTTAGDEKLESLTHRRRLVPKPPAKNEPKVLIKTRPSASLGFASTLILPVSARTTGNNNRNDEVLSNDNTTNGSGEVKNTKKATTPRVAKRKWMIN